MGARGRSRVLALFALACLMTTVRVAADQATPVGDEVIVDIRIHGNHTTPDADVRQLLGLEVGRPYSDDLIATVESRLRASGRFRHVEVRKRYASIADPAAIVLVVVVEEKAGVSVDVPSPGPLRALGASTMWLPVLSFEDGYGFTYGARVSFVDLLGERSRLSVPLTWGGERRAALEFERRFERGPLSRLLASGAIWRRENPTYDIGDVRREIGLRAERALATPLRVGAFARAADVSFGDLDDRADAVGIDVSFDTRRDPSLPRNAVHAAATWERLWFDSAPDTHRVRLEVGGGLGLIGQSVMVVRGQYSASADPLPPYERALLGGASSLRGFRAGYRTGDRLAAATAELRVPFTAPRRLGRLGLAVFADTGTTCETGEQLRTARFDTGVGAGLFISAAVFSMRVDVARRAGGGSRGHFTLGVKF